MTGLAVFDGPWLPLPPFPPDQVGIDGPWLWDTEAETVFSTRTSLGEVDDPYVVSASRVEPALVTLLRGEQDVLDDIAYVYATPPPSCPWSCSSCSTTTVAGATTDYDRVAAIQALFRDPANGLHLRPSTVSPPAAPGRTARSSARRGYCEQFARRRPPWPAPSASRPGSPSASPPARRAELHGRGQQRRPRLARGLDLGRRLGALRAHATPRSGLGAPPRGYMSPRRRSRSRSRVRAQAPTTAPVVPAPDPPSPRRRRPRGSTGPTGATRRPAR